MRRSLKNLIVFVMALVMMFSMSIVAFAAGDETNVKSITIVNEGTTAKVKAATLYENGDNARVDDVYLDELGKVATAKSMTYDLVIAGQEKDKTVVKDLSVATKNRAVATAELKTVDGKDKLVVTATGTGKTTITVKDAATNKSAKLTVTVKKLVDAINFSVVTEADELAGTEYVHLERGGKLNLQAATNADASSKKVKYTILEHKVWLEGAESWQDSLNAKNKTQAVVTVDNKGNVKAAADKRENVVKAKAVVRVYALDQKVYKNAKKNKTGASGIYEDITVYVYPASYASNDIIQYTNLGECTNKNKKLGKTNTYAAQTLFTNVSESAHTLKVAAAAYNKGENGYVKASAQKVTYTTSNAKVATVSPDGVVTAVGNGKATISAVPAYGLSAPKATVQVNVKTKAESIAVAADSLKVAVGKTVKANASVAKNVSSKKFLYVSSDETIATVNAKGVIKGIKEGTVTITVGCKDYESVQRKIQVEVIVPVNNITLTETNGTLIKNNKVTLYAWDASKLTTTAPNTVTFNATATGKNGAVPTYTDLDYAFDKEIGALATKSGNDFTVTATTGKAGKANLKIKATDGSNKSKALNVTVKRLVDEINVANAYTKYDEALGKNVQVVNVVKGTKVTLKATANADASNKNLNAPVMVGENAGITLNKWNVTVAADATEKAVLTISAKDGVKIGDTTTVAFAQTVIINPVDKATYSKADEVELDVAANEKDAAYMGTEDGFNVVMKKGASINVTPIFKNDEVIDRTVTWKSSNKNAVAVKNGVITAKKNADAVVTMTFKGQNADGTPADLTKTIKVCVVQSDADYQKALNKTVDANLKAEDRTYLGLNVKFNNKNNTINANINDATVVITEQKDTGILTVLESMVELTTQKVTVVDTNKNVTYTFERAGIATVNVLKNGEVIAVVDTYSAATKVLTDELAALGYITLGDMNGFNAEITVENAIITAEGYPALNNFAYYTMNCSMDSAEVEAVIDAKIAAEMAALKESGVLDAAGIESVTYNAETNAAVVNIKDGRVTLEAVDAAARTAVAEALKNIFDGAASANVNVFVDGVIDEAQTFDASVEDLDTAINRLFDKVKEKVGAKTEIGTFDGGKADARVFYQFGTNSYSYDYTVKFARTASAVDAQVDERITAEITNVKTGDTGLSATYNAEANVLTVLIDQTANSVLSLNDTGLFAAIENTLKDVAKASAKVSAVITVNDVQTKIDDLENVTVAQLEEAFALNDKVTLGDMIGETAIITVVYPQITGEVSLTYTVNYEFNLSLVDSAMNDVIAAALADAMVKDAVIADATYADHKINVTLDAAKNKMIKDADAIYEVFKAAIPTGENGISAVEVTFAGNDYQKTYAAADITKLVMEEVLTNTAGVDGLNMVSDLEDAVLAIKVVYSKNNVECALVYNVAFDVINKTADVQAPVEDESTEESAEEVTEETTEETSEEETTEEATEETVEETTEEATEETVEETTEEASEEATEETVEETEVSSEEITEEVTETVVEE